MTNHQVYDWTNTSPDLVQHPPDLAILPVGAVEPFGPHLPVGAAVYVLDAIARQVAARLPERVYLLPTWPLGESGLYANCVGTVSLAWRTLFSVVTDLIESLLDTGVRRVAVLAGLGGAACTTVMPRENRIVKTAVRQANYVHPDLDAIWVQPLTVSDPPLSALCASAAEDVHAGQVVTSLMLHLHPALVRQDQIVDHIPTVGVQYIEAAPFSALCPAGVWGRPSLASAEMGARMFEAAVHGTMRYIQESLVECERLKRRASPAP